MSELFDEVDEEVRRDQLKKLWDQYSIYIVAGALLIVAAVAGWRGYQYLEAKKAAEAGASFDKAVELSEQNKHTEAEAAFVNLAANAPSGYRALARLRAGRCERVVYLTGKSTGQVQVWQTLQAMTGPGVPDATCNVIRYKPDLAATEADVVCNVLRYKPARACVAGSRGVL